MENVNSQKTEQIEAAKRLQDNLNKIKKKVIILSGKGGVGKSTVSVNVALGLAKNGYKVGILDVDIHGPSIAKMLGIEDKKLLVAKSQKFPAPIRVNDNLYAMSIANLISNPDEPIIWRGPIKIGVIKQFMQDINWPELDFLIIDSPPGTGDEPLSVVQTLNKVDGAIIVSTPQDIALLDARKTIKFSQKMDVPILGIVENMSTFACPHCGEAIDIFAGLGIEKAAKDFDVEIIGKIPLDPQIVKSGDSGISHLENNQNSTSAIAIEKMIKKIEEKIG
ncbi:MAG: Mrp/NBP35 family ATP-binding protein [Candidatus Cloacimonetes bacterium]|nr:Mrp/NBP35 family ATP-binding protein [Candidatus Cloacimonadota bacterium]MBT6994966.1 Mrp/NBP35 family ATP-binding protein [Candidatus Cloacimonadota bacterium]MBT7469159.1 Mrp/NBP35 family ATP-binding protein [Candidatus Cloacimonadota bacterium]